MEYYNQVIETAFGNWEIQANDHYLFQISHLEEPNNKAEKPNSLTQKAFNQLNEYFEGKRKNFDFILNPEIGTSFQKEVWKLVSNIPYGKTISYQEIALKLDNPGSVRAVGAANGKNPIPIIIPCHRVIGSDGRLTGYAYGIKLKKQLLLFEKAISPDLFD